MLILIIEDEAAIARFLKRGLNAHGHRVICAYDGEEGTRLAVDEPVDLVLLDISLPRLDGREVLRRIRLRRPALSGKPPSSNGADYCVGIRATAAAVRLLKCSGLREPFTTCDPMRLYLNRQLSTFRRLRSF